MDILNHISSDLLERYAKWIAYEDMKRIGIVVMNMENVNIKTKEKIKIKPLAMIIRKFNEYIIKI